MRAGHPFAKSPTLARYCEMRHLVVSLRGGYQGFVDEALSRQGRSRRIALTVPNFTFALGVVAETDLISAMPRRFVAMHAWTRAADCGVSPSSPRLVELSLARI